MKDTIQQLIWDQANSFADSLDKDIYESTADAEMGFHAGANFILEEHNQINKELLEALKSIIDIQNNNNMGVKSISPVGMIIKINRIVSEAITKAEHQLK